MAPTVKPAVPQFRLTCPEFSNAAKYPDEVLQNALDQAQCFISLDSCPCSGGSCRVQAVYWLAAHIQTLADRIASGQSGQSGFTTSASIDKVSVSTAPPPTKNGWDYWLSLTPRGMQFLAYITSKTGFGIYVGGQFEQVFR